MSGVHPVTSPYAVHEVDRNITSIEQRRRLDALLFSTRIISDADVRFVSQQIVLVDKDRPILAAAIAGSIDFLVTGDSNHFGHLYGSSVSGVQVLSPAAFLDKFHARLRST